MKNPKTLSIIWKHQSYNLLFLSMELHVLKGIYRKPTYVSKTLRLFYESNLLLLQENITSDLNISAMFFYVFHPCMATLYGDAPCGFNVHNLCHIAKCVEYWGSLLGILLLFFLICYWGNFKSYTRKGNAEGKNPLKWSKNATKWEIKRSLRNYG